MKDMLEKPNSLQYSRVRDDDSSELSEQEIWQKNTISLRSRVLIVGGGLLLLMAYSILLLTAASTWWKRERLHGAGVIDSMIFDI